MNEDCICQGGNKQPYCAKCEPPQRPEVVKALPAPQTDPVVDAWYAETFHNLGLDTALQNRFYAAKEDLKKRIRNALAQ